jgi:hypothetical protein
MWAKNFSSYDGKSKTVGLIPDLTLPAAPRPLIAVFERLISLLRQYDVAFSQPGRHPPAS